MSCCVVGGLCDLPRGTGVTLQWSLASASGTPENFADYAAVHIALMVGPFYVGVYSTEALANKLGDVEAVSGQPTQCQIHLSPEVSIGLPLGTLEVEMMRVYTDSNYPDNERPVITKLKTREVKDSPLGNLIYG